VLFGFLQLDLKHGSCSQELAFKFREENVAPVAAGDGTAAGGAARTEVWVSGAIVDT